MNWNSPAALVAALNGDMENAIVAATPGGIEAQEAQGQRDLVASSKLPIEVSGPYDGPKIDWAIVTENTGIILGQKVDDLFVTVILPEGWQLKASEHAMHSDLLDAAGAKRASVFYKAAFYDRRADMRWNPRYYKRKHYPDHDVPDSLQWDEVYDAMTDTVMWTSDKIESTLVTKNWDADSMNTKAAHDWLAERFPEHNDPFAYWA